MEQLKNGKVGLVLLDDKGQIKQIGLTSSQSECLQVFAATLSKDNPFILLGEEYDLDFKYKN